MSADGEQILRVSQVMGRVGLRRTAIYSWVKAGKFPAPVKLGSRAIGWRKSDIDAFINSLCSDQRKAA